MVGYIQRITVLLMGLQAALKMSHIELNLFTDTDMHLFIKERIFWDVSFIRHCFTEENDPKMEDYDGNKCNEYLIYLDANNLYGYAILQLTQMPNLNGWKTWINLASMHYQWIVQKDAFWKLI